MKVKNMLSHNGNKVPNQFVIDDGNAEYFQSYDTVIVKLDGKNVYIDTGYPFSVTTSKYTSLFLGETSKEIKRKIKSGEYILADLNK